MNQEEHRRALGALKASHERSLERIVNEEKEQWRNETDDLLRTSVESAREEWKVAKAKELEKSLAFWRNTWDVEKDRAIQEALLEEQQRWEASVAGRIEVRPIGTILDGLHLLHLFVSSLILASSSLVLTSSLHILTSFFAYPDIFHLS